MITYDAVNPPGPAVPMPRPPRMVSPARDARYRYRSSPPEVPFQWRSVDDSGEFRLQVALDDTFEQFGPLDHSGDPGIGPIGQPRAAVAQIRHEAEEEQLVAESLVTDHEDVSPGEVVVERLAADRGVGVPHAWSPAVIVPTVGEAAERQQDVRSAVARGGVIGRDVERRVIKLQRLFPPAQYLMVFALLDRASAWRASSASAWS